MAYGPDFDWKTPDIREAEDQLDRSARAVRDLAEQIEREGYPALPEQSGEPAQPTPRRGDDDGEDNVVLRHSSW